MAEATADKLTEAERNLLASDKPLYKVRRSNPLSNAHVRHLPSNTAATTLCAQFVFTGGPCGGKTTALARVFSYLRERGFEVITVPETFTVLNSNGMSFHLFGTEGMAKVIQDTVLKVQLTMEDGVERVLRARGAPAVVLCDRGTMDGSVYLPPEHFQKIMEDHRTDVVQLRDNRYSAIFHLVTAADGAEEFYTLENNKSRTETAEEAREVDRRTQNAWVGSPHLYVLDNSTDFEGKMSRLVDIIAKIVGLPSNLRRRSAKFLLRSPPDLSRFPANIDYKVFDVEKVYLSQAHFDSSNPANYAFIRKRTNASSGGSIYQLTTVRFRGEELVEQKRIISLREYAAAYRSRDEQRHVVRQRRVSFLYNCQSFVVHRYLQPAEGLCVLHAQVEAPPDGSGDAKVVLPPFLDVERRLADTPEDECKYGAYNLSIKADDSV